MKNNIVATINGAARPAYQGEKNVYIKTNIGWRTVEQLEKLGLIVKIRTSRN